MDEAPDPDAPEFCGSCQTLYTLRYGHRCEIDSDVEPIGGWPATARRRSRR